MKIPVSGESKGYLSEGRHLVEITEVDEGTSEYKGVPFFNCRFENEEGFINHRFYTSKPGMPIVINLFKTVGIDAKEGQSLNTNELKGKKLYIQVGERTYDDPEDGHTKTIKVANEFEEYRDRK